MIEIQKRFVIRNVFNSASRSILRPHRRYITEGTLLLENTSNPVATRYYCYLFNDVFVTARIISRKKPLQNIQELLDILELQYVWIIEETVADRRFICRTADRCCFGLLTPQQNYMFRCESPQQRKKWTTAIGEAISDHMLVRPGYLTSRSVSFPKWNNGKWRFSPLEQSSLSLQMAKHVYIRNTPPSCLLQNIHPSAPRQRASSELIFSKQTSL